MPTQPLIPLLSLFPEPTLLVEPEGLILAANQAARDAVGAGRDVEGKRLSDLATDSTKVSEYLRTCARSRQMLPGAIWFRRGSAEPVRCRAQGALLRARSEAHEAVVLLRLLSTADTPTRFALLTDKIDKLTREVVRRTVAEAALRESEEWLRVVLTSIGDAVIATDDGGRVLFANPVAQSLTGWPVEEARGRPLDEVFVIRNEQTGEPAESPARRVLREGCVTGLANHTMLLARDGTARPIDDSGAPIRTGKGEVSGVVLVFRGISERRAAEHERERLLAEEQRARLAAESARAEADEANRAKDRFLSTLSHELRTPLTAIVGWSDILRTRAADPQLVERALTIIARNAQVQARLIEDMLDMSRIIAGKLCLNIGVVDVRAVARAAIDVVRPAAETKGVALEAALGSEVMPVRGDGDRLQQIVWNLLSNAIKFTPSGGRIELALARERARIVLRVTDTGRGIRADFLPHIFERFSQADTGYARAQGGLGLGLAIAKHLVDLHGGDIAATSDGPGRGAIFTITLPPVPTSDSQDERGAADEPENCGSLHGRRVLLVDDDPDSLEVVATVLHDRGADVISAASAADALAILERRAIDVLVSDIGMPGEDGLALLAKARRLLAERKGRLPALALTAYASAEDARAASRAGFDAYLAKPVAPEPLVAAVARLARARRAAA